MVLFRLIFFCQNITESKNFFVFLKALWRSFAWCRNMGRCWWTIFHANSRFQSRNFQRFLHPYCSWSGFAGHLISWMLRSHQGKSMPSRDGECRHDSSDFNSLTAKESSKTLNEWHDCYVFSSSPSFSLSLLWRSSELFWLLCFIQTFLDWQKIH